jgi:hypothetical protein
MMAATYTVLTHMPGGEGSSLSNGCRFRQCGLTRDRVGK